MIRKLSVRFPYRHVIQWSMHVNDQRQHDLNIEVRTSSRANQTEERFSFLLLYLFLSHISIQLVTQIFIRLWKTIGSLFMLFLQIFSRYSLAMNNCKIVKYIKKDESGYQYHYHPSVSLVIQFDHSMCAFFLGLSCTSMEEQSSFS